MVKSKYKTHEKLKSYAKCKGLSLEKYICCTPAAYTHIQCILNQNNVEIYCGWIFFFYFADSSKILHTGG